MPRFALNLLARSAIHEGAITSVRFQSGSGGVSGGTQVLTNSMDSSLKLVDVRTGTAIHTFRHPEFATSYGWSSACFSPGGGAYVAAGSNSTGEVLVWSTADGTLRAKLSGHTGGVCGVDWGRGGSNGQQVASIDRKGLLILWA
jgi:WD40 repeat protein